MVKKIKPVESSSANTVPSTDFPRGNSLPQPNSDVIITPFELKRIHKLAEKDARTSKKHKRSKTQDQFDEQDESVQESKLIVDYLSFKRINVGVVLCAMVKEISDTSLILSLPNNLTGYVPITEVSNFFSQALHELQQTDGDSDDLPHLNEFFKPMQPVICCIVKKQIVPSKNLECSLKPSAINSLNPSLSRSSTFELSNLQVWMEVCAVEDKGYSLDAGVAVEEKGQGKLNFFLPFATTTASSCSYKVGDLILVKVAEKSGRFVRCVECNDAFGMPSSSKDSAEALENGNTKKIENLENVASQRYDLIFPCQKISGTVKEIQRKGIVLDIGNGVLATMNLLHFSIQPLPIPSNPSTLDFPFSLDSSVNGTVIYIDYNEKRIGISQLPACHTSTDSSLVHQIGQAVNVEVLRSDLPFGALVRIEGNDGKLALLPGNRISDSDDKNTDIQIGSVHAARIVDYSAIEHLFIVSTQQSVLQLPFLRHLDIPVAAVVKGTIVKFTPHGTVVSLTDRIKAFCPALWSSDSQISSGKNPLSKYPIGHQRKFRIVSVDADEKRVILTSKRSLISTSEAVFSTEKDVRIGAESLGVVTCIKPFGIFVTFFGLLSGFVPIREMSSNRFVRDPAELVFVGKTVRCKVLQNEDSKILLSMKVDERMSIENESADSKVSQPRSPATIPFVVGQRVTAKVNKILPSKGLAVSIFASDAGLTYSALIHICDIEDTPTADPLSKFAPNSSIDCVVVEVVMATEGKRPGIFLSVKPSLLQTFTAEPLSLPAIDSTITGYVVTIGDGGVFVTINRHLDGRVQIRNLSVDYIKDWKALYRLGDVVTCKVIEITPQHQYELSIKAVQESLSQQQSAITWQSLQPDQSIECTVTNIFSYGVFLRILASKPAISGLCHRSQIPEWPNHGLKSGDFITASIATLDAENKKVTFSLSSSAIHSLDTLPSEDLPFYDAQSQPLLTTTDQQSVISMESTGFDWNSTDPQQSISNADSNESDCYSSDENQQQSQQPKTTSKRLTKNQRLLREELITQQEDSVNNALVNGPQNEEEFQRACISTPHDPIPYIQFMHWYLNRMQLDNARLVARSALKRIPFAMEQQRQSIWLALLSAENLYGTQESLDSTLIEARQSTDEKSLLIAFARILFTNGSVTCMERAERVYSLLVKRFPESFKCWKCKCFFYYLTKRLDDVRLLQQQAMRQLPQRKHIKANVQWALAERKYGNPERSRTLFESLVTAHPKRFDLWMVYWQSESDDAMRKYRVIERVAAMKWSVHKSKVVFKAWLEAAKLLQPAVNETSGGEIMGRDEAIAKVKAAAKRYVESLQ